ncbi:hypothetical protein PRZ48_007015 [Zasmidium cellare]|uniref:NADP-dependent oxidoreductase domain-containing protein n=1 Tax=Zasmidium cellare TaxID=395010 RepID=A0ABR0EJA5_ZASCE|nr:hypothetical protein PRZ48_007015 [Zasmidium cellare]
MSKTLILAGLGKYATPNPPSSSNPSTTDVSSIKAAVAAQTSTLQSLGFTCHNIDLNPNDAGDSLYRLEEVLMSQLRWDGFVIGYGLRGNKEYTELFEKVVCGSGLRFGFSTRPDGLVDTVERILPGKERERERGRVMRR